MSKSKFGSTMTTEPNGDRTFVTGNNPNASIRFSGINYDQNVAEFTSEQTIALYRHLEGRMLTMVEACFSDKEQRDAIKSLIHTTFSEEKQCVLEWLYDNRKGGEGATSFPY